MNTENLRQSEGNNQNSSPTTGNQGLVKDLNKAIVFNMIWRSAPTSRADISRASGLNRSTVSSLVDELIAEGYVTELGAGESALGRKPIMLQSNPDAGIIIGVELGVNYIRLIASDIAANVISCSGFSIDPADGVDRIVKTMLEAIESMAASVPSTLRGLIGVGVGVPGLVRSDSGVLAFAPNLKWRDVPLRDIMMGRLGIPVFVDNEANTAAMGERWFGAGVGVENMAYVSVGIGLGVGIVINGELYRGSSGYAGEMGHFTMQPDGPECGCGNRGCWETLASKSATIARVIRAIEEGRPTILAGHAKHRFTMDDLADACVRGDEVAREALEDTGRYLGIGIAGLINTFNPELVIVGSSVGRCSRLVLDEVEKEIRARGLTQLTKDVRVVKAALGADSCAIGGISLVLSDLLSLPKIAL
ncbi:MAG: ROK family transcriptional regulator [Firmicutes bacterium]|nr:ROK family transcriptional regulator [Bacillota bacterium]